MACGSGLKQLAAAILAPGVSVFQNMPPVLDASVMIEVMRALGFPFDRGRLDDMTACFAEDGVLEYLGKAPQGPAAIKAALARLG